MADVPIAFGPWEPDRAPHMSPALSEAVNVLPVAGAYAPFPAHVETDGAFLPTPARGFFAAPLADGSPIVFGATDSAIYRLRMGSTQLLYSNPGMATAPWSFAQFSGRIIAVNPGAPPLGATPGNAFTALGGSPSPAHCCAVVEKNFLVLGNLVADGVDGAVSNRVRWSGFVNPDTWGTSVGTQADFEDMPDEGGPVVAITGRETGTVFQRKAIVRMQYVGLPNVFAFTTVEQGRGALSAGAVCDVGNLDFFISDDGFYVWDGTGATPIGTDKVDRWFATRVNMDRLDRIVSGFDPVSRCVLWAFPQAGETYPSTMLAFSLGDGRWTQVDVAVEQIGASATLPTSLELMPTPDLAHISFDDPAYAGGVPVLAAIDSSHVYGTFTGAPLAATLVTGDWQSKTGQRSYITGVRPLIDCPGVTVATGGRDQTGAHSVSWGADTGVGVDGACPQRADGRYVRYRMTTPANEAWTRAVGIEPAMRASGRR